MDSYPTSLLLIGCGNMAGAMLSRWLATGMDPASVTVVRPSGRPFATGVSVVTEPPGLQEPPPAIALLGVKPQKLDEVAAVWRGRIGPQTTLVSILAGVEEASLRTRFPDAGVIVRAMPNTPVAIGKGATALFARDAAPSARAAAEQLMAPLGLVEWIADETLFDLVAALTASGPAFVFRFIDGLAKGAAALGLPPEQAARLALATVEGASALAAGSDEPPQALAERVASPGGMTRKGLDVLDDDEALNALVRRTLDAAARHSRAMGEAARGKGG